MYPNKDFREGIVLEVTRHKLGGQEEETDCRPMEIKLSDKGAEQITWNMH